MSDHKTGEWMDCTIAAKPASKKARHPYATVTAVFYVEGEYPDREVAERIVNAPVLLDAAERQLAAVEAERDALREALTRWGRWCHSPDGMAGELFHAAVEGTPADCFPVEG